MGNLYLVMRVRSGPCSPMTISPPSFEAWPTCRSPWRLALVLVMQYVEDLSDRQAADDAPGRIDWKYAASLGRTPVSIALS